MQCGARTPIWGASIPCDNFAAVTNTHPCFFNTQDVQTSCAFPYTFTASWRHVPLVTFSFSDPIFSTPVPPAPDCQPHSPTLSASRELGGYTEALRIAQFAQIPIFTSKSLQVQFWGKRWVCISYRKFQQAASTMAS